MEGKTIYEELMVEYRRIGKLLNHTEKELDRMRNATLNFYDEMIEAIGNTNNSTYKDGIAFACSRLTALLLDKGD